MARNKNMLGVLCCVSALLCVPILIAGTNLSNSPDNSCIKFLRWPPILIGSLILIVGMVGAAGGFLRNQTLVVLYLLTNLLLIVLLGCLAVMVHIVTAPGTAHPVPNRVYLEYRSQDFSGWLQRRVGTSFKWFRIRDCLVSRDYCTDMNVTITSAELLFSTNIDPIQSGCCKPPTLCGFQYVTATKWISPINMGEEMDCVNWNNEPTKLCFDCDSCKGGLLANIRKEWRKANVVFIATLVALIVVYVLTCFAYRRTKTEDIFDKYREGYT